MNKGIVVRNKGVLNNTGYKIITNVLWICAIVSMLSLVIIARELRTEVKDIKRELILHRK